MNIEFGGGENPRKKDYRQVDVRKIREDDIVCNAWEVEKHIQPNTVELYFMDLWTSQALTLKEEE